MYIKIEAFDGRWKEIPAIYPINLVNALDMTFDDGKFNSLGGIKPDPYTRVKITVGDSATSNKEKLFFYATVSEQWQPNGVNQYEWRMVEPSKELQGVFLDGAAHTIMAGKKKTLEDVVRRLLRITPLRRYGQNQKYYLTTEGSVLEVLSKAVSPQFQWSSQTSLWEALCDIGAYIDAIPRLTGDDNEYSVITFDFVNLQKSEVGSLDFFARSIDLDETQYCSQMESNVINMVIADKEEGNIVFPSVNAFVTPRSTGVRLTDTNCKIIMDKPISELEKVYIDASKVTLTIKEISLGEGDIIEGSKESITFEDLFGTTLLDVTERVLNKEQWNALPAQISRFEQGVKTKETCLYFERYSNTIEIQNEKFKGIGEAFSTNTWRMFISAAIYDLQPYIGAITPSNYQDYTFKIPGRGNPLYCLSLTSGYPVSFKNDISEDLRSYGFRVVYKPMEKQAKVRVSKRIEPSFDFVQPNNQRAEMNAARAFGRNMQGTVNRMGVFKMVAPVYVERWSDIKKVGSTYLYKGDTYFVTVVDATIESENCVQVVYYLSKDWNFLSQYFNVDKKFRNWGIPTENVQRNLYYSDVCYISPDEPDDKSNSSCLTAKGIACFMGVLKSDLYPTSEVSNMQMDSFSEKATIAKNIVSASSFGFADSIVLTASMRDNLAAGIAKADQQECKESFYTDENGFCDYCNIKFGGKVGTSDGDYWPSVLASINAIADDATYVDINSIVLEKDPAEVIAMTYQIDVKATGPGIIIGNEFVSNNPLCKQRTDNQAFKLWKLSKTIPPMELNVAGYGTESESATFNVNVTNETATLNVSGATGAWAITDEEGNLLIADNDGNKTLYFTFKSSLSGTAQNVVPDSGSVADTRVTITYNFTSPGGKGNKTKITQHIIASEFSVSQDIDGEIPEHFIVASIITNGTEAGDYYFATRDMTFDVALEFVSFTIDFVPDAIPVEILGVNNSGGYYGYTTAKMLPANGSTEAFKPGRYTFIDFPSTGGDNNNALEYFKLGNRVNSSLWQAVVYVTNGLAVKPFHYLIDVASNASSAKVVDGRSSDTKEWTVTAQNAFKSSSYSVTYKFKLTNSGLYIEVEPFGTVEDINHYWRESADGNERWRFDHAKFKISSVSQLVDTEDKL